MSEHPHLHEVFESLSQPGRVGKTEADIQSRIAQLLTLSDLGITDVHLEQQIGDGTRRRIDIAVGATVIEVKKRLVDEEQAADYITQLSGYISTRVQAEKSRYNGILTDGRQWWLYELPPGEKKAVRRSTFELSNAEKGTQLVAWLQAVLATLKSIKPTPRSIETMLGANSPAYQQDYAYLSELYSQVKDDPTVRLKRDLWARLLRSALGTGFNAEADHLFYDHTLLVVEASAIAHAIVGADMAALAADPASMLRGDLFRQANIYNSVESDFFDWVLSTSDGAKFVQTMINRVATFDWSATEHDVLKVLYESVINASVRKGLGEYYTPDWLAEGIVEKSVTNPLQQRVLDPSCGSGTFIYHVVRRIIKATEDAGWGDDRNEELLNHLQTHVFGLDIHPVSVVLARVTYLLALGSKLRLQRGDIMIPIHLGDSMQWFQPGDYDKDIIEISTTGEDLTSGMQQETLFHIGETLAFPLQSVSDPSVFDQLVTALTDRAKQHTDLNAKRPNPASILDRFGIRRMNEDYQTLVATFNVLCDLNAAGRDSIWGYFVRNQARPLWLSMPERRVDVLVGNPPWVAYRFMTASMQEQFKKFSEMRGLWHGQKVATNQDLVSLFIVRAAEKYLKNGGRFGFVTPLAVLSRQQYEGFRSGDWGSGKYGHFTEVWDLEDIKPKGFFPVPSAVVYGSSHRYDAFDSAESREARRHMGFPSVKFKVTGKRDPQGWAKTVKNLHFTQTPCKELKKSSTKQSDYGSGVYQGATVVPRSLFCIREIDQSGSFLGAAQGTTTFEAFRTNQEKEPWKSLPSLSGVIEKRFVFDMHLGSTLLPFRMTDPWKIILPIEKDKLLTEKAIVEIPRLHDWWSAATELWENNRASDRLSLLEQLNFQNKLTNQLGGTPCRVAYSKSGTKLAASIVPDGKCIIDHTLYWIPCSSTSEARYISAILNAPVITERVSEYQSRGLFGARHFDTYVWQLPIPAFDKMNDSHLRLVTLAKQAEIVAVNTDVEGMGFQKARRLVRQALEDDGVLSSINDLVTDLLDGKF